MSYRNPILDLPAAQRLAELPDDARDALKAILIDLSSECAARADMSWRRGKAPMAAYWHAAGVYARHITRALR